MIGTAVFPNRGLQYNSSMALTGIDVSHLLNNLPGMVYRGYHNAQRTMLFVSEGSLALTGYLPQALELDSAIAFGDLIHPDDRLAVWQEIDTAIRAKRPYHCIYRLGTAAGQEQWVLDRGEARLTADGYLLEGFITDHTERVNFLQLLERRVADRTRKLSALYEIVDIASDPAPLTTTINRILESVLAAAKVEIGTIHLCPKSSQSLQLIAQHGLPNAIAKQLATVDGLSDNLIAQVWRQGKSLIEEDARLIEWRHRAYVGIPIVTNEQVQGVLSLFTTETNQFHKQEEMDLLLSVGEQIGGVVESTYLRAQAERLAVAEERNRLARALHDSVTQSLYSVTLFAEAGRNLAQAEAHKRASRYFDDVLQTSQQALKEMRLLVHNLRPSALEQEGLIRALQHRLNAVEGRAGIHHQLIVADDLRLPADTEEALYHISQEALNNAIKHAFASEVTVQISQADDGWVELQICDNGQGFEPEAAVTSGGLGLTSIHERVALLGGTVIFQSAPEQGTRIVVQLPVSRDQ
jgi:signal transduction histidine kinase